MARPGARCWSSTRPSASTSAAATTVNVGFFSKKRAAGRKALTRTTYPPLFDGRCASRGIRSMNRFAKLVRDKKGATAIEYGLIVALIVIAMIGGLKLFAGSTISMWNDVQQNVASNG
jgi:pilus assembly protein Flp/PilA